MHDHEVSLEYVNDNGRALVQKGGDRGDQLEADLAQLNHRFDATARAIDERLTLLESSVEQLAQMNVSQRADVTSALTLTRTYTHADMMSITCNRRLNDQMRYRRSYCALQSQLQALNQWMTDMEQFLATDDAATAADTETLQLQLKESAVRRNHQCQPTTPPLRTACRKYCCLFIDIE